MLTLQATKNQLFIKKTFEKMYENEQYLFGSEQIILHYFGQISLVLQRV